MIKKIIIFAIVIAVGVIAAKKLMLEKQKIKNQETPLTLNYSIKTIHAKDDVVYKKRPFLAKVVSVQEVKISTKLSGTIEKVFVSESQNVKKGELLVKIDDRSLQTTLKTLMQTLKTQIKDVEYYKSIQERNKKLLQANAISKEKYDASVLLVLNKEAQRDATKDKINAIKSDLTYLQIRAPFDGVISNVYLHEGDLALTGKPILTLSSIDKKMEFSYASTQESINVKDEVFYKNEKIGFVSKIYPNAKNNLNIAEVKLTKNIEARNDSYISIDIVIDSLRGCSVDINSLLHSKGKTYILVFKDNGFKKEQVDVLIENEQKAIIKPCTDSKIAVASESKLAILPFYKNITLIGNNDE